MMQHTLKQTCDDVDVYGITYLEIRARDLCRASLQTRGIFWANAQYCRALQGCCSETTVLLVVVTGETDTVGPVRLVLLEQ